MDIHCYKVQKQAELSNGDAPWWPSLWEKGKVWEHKGDFLGTGDVLVSDPDGGPTGVSA